MKSIFTTFKEALRLRGLEYFGRFYSSYRGTCYANDDPEQLGRIRVLCPQAYGDDSPAMWAWPRGLPAGKGHGFWFVPQPGDPVFISFENGDPAFPLYEHGWWVRGGVPAAKGSPAIVVLKTPAGHLLEFDDTAGTVHLRHVDGWRIDLTPQGIEIAGATGRTLGQMLESGLTELATLVVGTPLGPSGPPVRAAFIVQLRTELGALLK